MKKRYTKTRVGGKVHCPKFNINKKLRRGDQHPYAPFTVFWGYNKDEPSGQEWMDAEEYSMRLDDMHHAIIMERAGRSRN